MSQDDLANMAEVERAYVGHLERGLKNPTVLTLEKIAKALSVSISALFMEPATDDEPAATLTPGRKRA